MSPNSYNVVSPQSQDTTSVATVFLIILDMPNDCSQVLLIKCSDPLMVSQVSLYSSMGNLWVCVIVLWITLVY